jgi:dTDP-4-amino-4,6-dideoxygalactose transaminase
MSDSKFNLALLGGTPLRSTDKTWPIWPQYGAGEREALLDVLDNTNWWYGEKVRTIEQEFAAYQGAKYCLVCTSGTTALEICLQAMEIGHGDEVIVPPFTFVATASAVSRMGATPVFVDIDDSWNMDPTKIEAAITPNTKAIIPVHFTGRICDMDAINAIAQKHDLLVLEDASHSWGAKWSDGQGAGVLGDCGVFSFQGFKNLTAGEGGAMVTNNPELAAKMQSYINCGRKEGGVWYEHHNVGTNARLGEFQAALLSAQLKHLPEQQATRIRNGEILDEELSKIEGITPQPVDPRQTQHSRHIYCIRVDQESFGCSRERMLEALNAEGVPVDAAYPLPLYKQPVYAKTGQYDDVSCPVCEELCYNSAIWITHQHLLGSESDMEDIIAIFQKVKDNVNELSN